jgi:hypothetical protein
VKHPHNIKTFAKAVALCAVGVMLCLGWAEYITLYVHVSLGDEQTAYFMEAVQNTVEPGKAGQISDYIAAVTNYYPSGTKQKPESHVDRMVERSRALAIQLLEARRTSTTHSAVQREEGSPPAQDR